MGQLPGPSHGHQPERRPRRNGDVGCTPAVRPRPWHSLSASADASGAPSCSVPLKAERCAGRGGSASPLTAGWTFLAVGLASQSPGGLRGDTHLSVAAACALLASAIEAAAPATAGRCAEGRTARAGVGCRPSSASRRCRMFYVASAAAGGRCAAKSGSLRPGHRPEACLAQMSS